MQQNRNSNTSGLRTLPDLNICKAKDIGIKNFAGCLVDLPVECKYALHFGDSYFRKNPDKEK